MVVESLNSTHRTDLMSLFESVFTASEGPEEGKQLAKLVSELAANIDNDQIISLGIRDSDTLLAAIFFTRLDVPDPIQIYLLSPVAVSTSQQGKGIGQTLINHGLKLLQQQAVDLVVTYGDPDYYCKVGFQPIPETLIKAPHALSMPQGWLAQSLQGTAIPTSKHKPTCVTAFNNPSLW